MKLQNKIILLFAGTISLVCSIALLIVTIQSAGFGENLSNRLNTQLIESKAAEASSWLIQRVDELRIISRSSEAMSMDMEDIRPFIDRLNDEFSANYGNQYGTFALGGMDGLGYVTGDQTIDVSERDYFLRLQNGEAEYTLSTPVYSKTDRTRIVLICYAIHDQDGEMVGFVNGAISLKRLTDLTDEIDFYGGTSFIADAAGNLYTNLNEAITPEQLDAILAAVPQGADHGYKNITLDQSGMKQEIFFTPIPQTDWYLCSVVDHRVLFEDRQMMLNSIIVLWIALLIVGVCLSVFIGRLISRPVNDLSAAMKRVEEGDFTITLEARGNDETAHLTRQFNYMVVKIRELIAAVEQEQKELYRTQFQVLQNQINPHFLYNTLDTLQWQAADYGADELVELINALSGFFRVTLSKGQDFIPLERELDHIRYYLIIQQYRYADILSYQIEVPPEMGKYQVSRLILQPIVENAIYHGIRPKLAPGWIKISGSEWEDRLEIMVTDNGVGMDEDQLIRVRDEMNGQKTGESIGLRNIRQRIQMIYGMQYGIQIESKPGQGTCVRIVLPKEKGRKANGSYRDL